MAESIYEKCPKCENSTFIIERNVGATVIRCSNCNNSLITLQMGRISFHLYPQHKINDIPINTYEYCEKLKSNRRGKSKIKDKEK